MCVVGSLTIGDVYYINCGQLIEHGPDLIMVAQEFINHEYSYYRNNCLHVINRSNAWKLFLELIVLLQSRSIFQNWK